MVRPSIWIAAIALYGLGIVDSRGADSENAQTAGQISSKRDKACKGLKGTARDQCLEGYVGPDDSMLRYGRDSVYANRKGLSKPKPWKTEGDPAKPGRSLRSECENPSGAVPTDC